MISKSEMKRIATTSPEKAVQELEKLQKRFAALEQQFATAERLKAENFKANARELNEMQGKIAELEAENELLEYEATKVHTCHDRCQRPFCVANRKLRIATNALKFYAHNWRYDVYVGPTQELFQDSGQLAARALKCIGDENIPEKVQNTANKSDSYPISDKKNDEADANDAELRRFHNEVLD